MKYNLSEMTKNICDISRKAGLAIMEIYKSDDFGTKNKDDNSPLTKADIASDKIIGDGLTSLYPEIAILSEEKTDNNARLSNPYCFIVDPLDGTKEFINKTGEFTVNIALSYNNKTVLGVIYVPFLDEIYFAYQGGGAFKISKNGETVRLQVSNSTSNLILVASKSHGSNQIDVLCEKYNISSLKKAGSSLKGCLIASGVADIYYRFGLTMEWDTAAMQCIIEEAGGIFRQMDNSPMLYNRINSLNEKGFFAVNKKENIFDV